MKSQENGAGKVSLPLEKVTVSKDIPTNGNLCRLGNEEFMEILKCLKLEKTVLERCFRLEMDGNKFLKLSVEDLSMLKMEHPVLQHFKENTSEVK